MIQINSIDDLVQFTGKEQLTLAANSETEMRRWFMIWAAGLAGEHHEYIVEQDIEAAVEELGDISWYFHALWKMFFPEISPSDDVREEIEYRDSFSAAMYILEYAKKCFRDGSARQIDISFLRSKLMVVRNYIYCHPDIKLAEKKVILKLIQRYPNGFDPEKSVNRK